MLYEYIMMYGQQNNKFCVLHNEIMVKNSGLSLHIWLLIFNTKLVSGVGVSPKSVNVYSG
jgi:hypothetical protein